MYESGGGWLVMRRLSAFPTASIIIITYEHESFVPCFLSVLPTAGVRRQNLASVLKVY